MQNKKLILSLFTALLFTFCKAQTADAVLSYISRYKDLAIAEMQRTGVPASITLAQGIHETEAGTSELVLQSNNHFGIKCKSGWTGESVSHDDDARGECFRKYALADDSYRDHSDFLRGNDRYAFLFQLNPMDFESWAYGLKKAGYATNPKYSQILIKLIRDYNLQDFTMIAMGKKKDPVMLVSNDAPQQNNPVRRQDDIVIGANSGGSKTAVSNLSIIPAVNIETNYPTGEFQINETRVVFVKKGTSFLSIAQKYEIPLARLFEFNDMKEQDVTDNDQLVFIQRKRKNGEHELHVIQPGETVYSISQSEAIRLESLLEYNLLRADMQPAAGETLNLRTKAMSAPQLVVKQPAKPVVQQPEPRQSIVRSDDNDRRAGTSGTFLAHTVQPKETVYSIAKKYDVSFEDVVKWNQLDGFDLKIGQSLKIYK
jgi:LysM repeat protein